MTRKYLVPISTPSVSFGDDSSFLTELFAGRSMAKLVSDAGVADGFLQQSFARKKIYLYSPGGSSNSVQPVLGSIAPINFGSLTTRNQANTNMFTRTRRLGFVSAATAGSVSGTRMDNAQLYLGDGTFGGFYKSMRFGCSDAATVSGARQFCGMSASIAAGTNVEPSTLTNCIGVGNGASDTNLFLYYGGSAAQTPIDLGANFPANTLSADLYELTLYSPSNETSKVYWRVERLNTGHVASGDISGSGGVILPSASTRLSLLWCFRSNNATALAVGLDIISDYVETDY